MKNKKNVLIILSIVAFIIVIGGISFSYFVYNKNLGDVSINTGEISINYSDVNGNMSLTGIIPKSDNEGKISTDYIDFTVDGIVDTDKIYYELSIVPNSGNTLDTQYIKVYLTDQEDNDISGVSVYSNLSLNEKENGKRLYRETIDPNQDGTKKTYTKDFRLRVWLDESYSESTTKTFEFNVNLFAKNVENDYEIPEGSRLVKKAIEAKKTAETNSCNPVWIDDNGTANDESDDITYFSGTTDCVDMNYVWYSGKLWRITAIYPDGTMKLITENNITSIAFNASNQVNFYTDANTTSYMYQWLNEDFYDTLYNANQFIDTTKQWNATMPADTNMVTANVGLLNNYEYYNSYRCISSATCTGTSYGTGYLNIGYYWWLLNPYSSSNIWRVSNNGIGSNYNPASTYGARPSIYLKSGLEFTGNGSKQSPYKIVGDKDAGAANELINTRISGEYVKLKNDNNEQLFRIIGVEDNKTKIIAMDYADNKSTKKFATSSSDTLWGSGTTTDTDTWYTYLNDNSTGYLKNLKDAYGELFDSGLYYLGTSGYNYKLSVCANTTSGNTKICDKTSQVGTFNIGLPRYGEMFATQQDGGYSNSSSMWLINRYLTSLVWYVDNYGNGGCYLSTNSIGARPTVHLKSSVKIISGTGTETDPYVVGL